MYRLKMIRERILSTTAVTVNKLKDNLLIVTVKRQRLIRGQKKNPMRSAALVDRCRELDNVIWSYVVVALHWHASRFH